MTHPFLERLFETVPEDDGTVLASFARVARDVRRGDPPRTDDETAALFRSIELGFEWNELGMLDPSDRRALGDIGAISTGFSLFAPGWVGVHGARPILAVVGDLDDFRIHSIRRGSACRACLSDCLEAIADFEQAIGDLERRSDISMPERDRIGVVLCLPGAEQARVIDAMLRKALEYGCLVGGSYDERSASRGSEYCLEVEFGDDPESAAARLDDVASTMASFEAKVRRDLAERRGVEVADRVHRALAIGQRASLMGLDEAAALIASLRLGISAGFVKNVHPSSLSALSRQAKAIGLARSGDGSMDGDEERAHAFREALRDARFAGRD